MPAAERLVVQQRRRQSAESYPRNVTQGEIVSAVCCMQQSQRVWRVCSSNGEVSSVADSRVPSRKQESEHESACLIRETRAVGSNGIDSRSSVRAPQEVAKLDVQRKPPADTWR